LKKYSWGIEEVSLILKKPTSSGRKPIVRKMVGFFNFPAKAGEGGKENVKEGIAYERDLSNCCK
jgi:hypothetical protein